MIRIRLKPGDGVVHIPMRSVLSLRVFPDGSGEIQLLTGLLYTVKDGQAVADVLARYESTGTKPQSIFEAVFGK